MHNPNGGNVLSANPNGGNVPSAETSGDQKHAAPMILWQITIAPLDSESDRLSREVETACHDAGIDGVRIWAARGYLVQGRLEQADIESLCIRLLADSVVERFAIERPCHAADGHGQHIPAAAGDSDLAERPGNPPLDPQRAGVQLYHVLPKPGVTDSQAETAMMAAKQLGFDINGVRTFRQYAVAAMQPDLRPRLENILANDSIEQLIEGPIRLAEIQQGQPYKFRLTTVPIIHATDSELQSISSDWQLSLSLTEMQTIQRYFAAMSVEPSDIELETIAQTWSEHCSHKTLAGRIEFTDENGARVFDSMLKETIFAATTEIRSSLGADDWCVSVFQDNAGIVRFDDETNVTFKVETHNRPSAIEPYGGANTGVGGVIRDTLGTGMGARPVCGTDVFCFADPSTPHAELPPGVLHPRRVMRGVVAGVRDYGNRMGIPTVNGAVCFDQRYVGNPLVFCGSVGLLPRERSFKQPQPGDLIVAIGGRTGRDGIRGATFSSAELTENSDVTSGGAVQIGNAITEKMLMDVLLAARDENLFNAVTDCGAGGFSSAVGEMGQGIGAEVWLEKAPLKYAGLSYTEIWISEAQERMVFAVPESNWPRFHQLCEEESVEATVLGEFCPTGELVLTYEDEIVGRLPMDFLHDGRPPVVRQAIYKPLPVTAIPEAALAGDQLKQTRDLVAILGCLNVASKHWIIRQYDHEVQGGSVIKPLVGPRLDGPSDAAVLRPRLHSRRGLAVACAINPRFGDLDTYHMAASSIDEAIRNCVAVGADPDRIAILDNFCWGCTDRPETLGSLVRAAIACRDMAVAFGTPFISGKDSLHNEFSYTDRDGRRQAISIPPTLLISALGQIDDVQQCVTMDLKQPGSQIYLLGTTRDEMGGSHWSLVNDLTGGQVPRVDAAANRSMYRQLHQAIRRGLVRSCHDLSEGGLAVAAAEMAFAGGWGMQLNLERAPGAGRNADSSHSEQRRIGNSSYTLSDTAILFSESNGRLLCEVEAQHSPAFESLMASAAQLIGSGLDSDQFNIAIDGRTLIAAIIDDLKAAWLAPLDWS